MRLFKIFLDKDNFNIIHIQKQIKEDRRSWVIKELRGQKSRLIHINTQAKQTGCLEYKQHFNFKNKEYKSNFKKAK